MYEINGAVYKDMIINAAAAIEQQKQPINELNVFPVPDGDTGTNMSLTMKSAATELKKKSNANVTAVADAAASALLRGARGNSGVILSLLFRGMAKAMKDLDSVNTAIFAEALSQGVTAAYKAVMKPTEGTILTVSRLTAEYAVAVAQEESDFDVFFERIIERGNEALADTVNQNPVLKKAGVIDAGGKGYMCILDGMLKAMRGEMIEVSSEDAVTAEKADFASFDTEDIKFMYCTEFIVQKENMKSVDVLRDYLNNIGDSIVVVDDDEIIKVHVHTNTPGNVLTEALTYGSLLTTKIENMKEQHTEKIVENSQEDEEDDTNYVAPAEKQFGFVAVCAGDGMAEIFRDLGVDGIITGGQTMNPSTEDILKEVNKTPAETVFVLPNNKNIIMAAEQCVQLSEKKVIVIPTKTVPQGVSAMLSVDLSINEEECIAALSEAIERTHTAQITYAARDSDFDGHEIKAGEYLALLENKLLANGADFDSLLGDITSALGEFSPELVNVFYGEDVDEDTANKTLDAISAALPGAEVTLIYGGQPVYYYMISAE